MDINKKWYYEKLVARTMDSLKSRNYDIYCVDTREDARDKVLELIEEGSSIGVGGSATLNEIEILPEFRNGRYTFLDRYKPGLSPDEIQDIFRQSFSADYYVSSVNAITVQGELVNMDFTGNRAGAIMFGPKKVIIVAGYNKIALDLESAISRVREYASPINSRRLNKKTPCAVTGECADCTSPDRICGNLVVTYKQTRPGRGIVILVGEELGY
jgi:hypothetical protein